MKNIVFVYGTLRTGLAWNHLLSSAKFLGQAITQDKYALYAEGIPYVIKNKVTSRITGEVYEVDEMTLANLDRLEGHPNWYCREEIPVILEEKQKTAWIYFFPKSSGQLIESGNYLDYREKLTR